MSAGAVKPSFIRRVAEYIDWRANPMLVKDLRLWLRARIFIIAYMTVLSLTIICSSIYAIAVRNDNSSGDTLWVVLLGVMLVLCGAAIPHMIYDRFCRELQNRATEPALLSKLTPARIVRGKWMSSVLVSLLVFSAISPAFAVAYLLGGVDLLVVLYSFILIITASVCLPCLQLYLATLSAKRTLRIFGIGVFLAEAGTMVGYASVIGNEFMRRNMLSRESTWYGTGAIFLIAYLAAYFFYHVAASRLRTPTENRDRNPRFALMLAAYVPALAVAIYYYFVMIYGRSAYYLSDTSRRWIPFLLFGVIAAIIFGIGSLFVTKTAEYMPRIPWKTWPRKGILHFISQPGTGHFCGFLLFNYFVFLIAAFPYLLLRKNWRMDDYLFAKLFFCSIAALGSATIFHEWVVKRLTDKATVFMTFLGLNIFLVIVTCACYFTNEAVEGRVVQSKLFILLNPMTNMFWADYYSRESGYLHSIFEAALAGAGMGMICVRQWRADREKRRMLDRKRETGQ